MGTTTMNITNTDLRPAPSGARRAASPIRPGLLPHALFVAELLGAPACVRRPGQLSRAALRRRRWSALGTPVLVRSDPRGQRGRGLPADAGRRDRRWSTAAMAASAIEAAAETREAAAALAGTLRAALASKAPEPERVSIAFWMRGEPGGDVRHREIDAESFEQIAGNYSASGPVRARAPDRDPRAGAGPPAPVARRAGHREVTRAASARAGLGPVVLGPLHHGPRGAARARRRVHARRAHLGRRRRGPLAAADPRGRRRVDRRRRPRDHRSGAVAAAQRDRRIARAGHADDAPDHDQRAGRAAPSRPRDGPVAAWPISSSHRCPAARPTPGWRRMDASAGSTGRRRWPSCSRRPASRPSKRPRCRRASASPGPSTNTRRSRAERPRASAYQFVIDAVTM